LIPIIQEGAQAKPVYLKGNMSASSSYSSLNKESAEVVPKTSMSKVYEESIAKKSTTPASVRSSHQYNTKPDVVEVKKELPSPAMTPESGKLGVKAADHQERTISPKPRRHVSDVGALATKTKDGADLKQIKLPSVKRLAQQFQVNVTASSSYIVCKCN
jgi:hypothetical protein